MKRIYSEEFKRVLIQSRNEASKHDNKLIHPEHFVLGMLREPNNDSYEVLNAYVEDIESLRLKMEDHLMTYSKTDIPFEMPTGAINLDSEAGLALQNSMLEANIMNTKMVSSPHLLLALIRDKNNFVSQTLVEHNMSYETLCEYIKGKYGTEMIADDASEEQDGATIYSDLPESEKAEAGDSRADSLHSEPSSKSEGRRGKGSRPLEYLKKYGTDLTLDALQGKLDPVVGRQNEIERLAQILSRRKKNNPILIGEAGVGKTAIVEGLAQRIAAGAVPVTLLDKRLFSLNMAMVVAGTKYRGQFEERLQCITKELESNPEVILFIDEIHTMIGAGSAQGSMDAANILKPALSRGKLQCIGATTIDEYRKTIEKDGALERRFQKIIVNPTTPEETIQILNNIKERYEQHHNVRYTDRALELCVKLTDRYISDRKLPDKAIDALDEAGSLKHITEIKLPDSLKAIEAEMESVGNRKSKAVKEQRYEEASQLRDKLSELKDRFTQQKADWLLKLKETPAVVDDKDVEHVVSIMSGIPVHKMAQAENIKLKQLKSDLQHTIIAQDKAIEKLVKAITRNRIGLRDPNKPIGTFLFLGPTGVGKTYLAKKLADYMFGSEEALIRIDMSEYMEKFSTSRLVGAPPGYVGYEEGGQLTEKVRRRPYSIVLFDEIEKANKDVFNILLQVMDEGRLTDNNGVTVDFRNTIIILTSNCGSRELQDFGNAIGFCVQDETKTKAYADQIIMKSLNKQFAPEFINRVDDIILFDHLDKNAIGQIIDNELGKLSLRLAVLGFSLNIDDEAKQFLVNKSFDKKYGARPLKRAIQTYVEDGISDYLIDNEARDNTTGVIHISKRLQKEELVFE